VQTLPSDTENKTVRAYLHLSSMSTLISMRLKNIKRPKQRIGLQCIEKCLILMVCVFIKKEQNTTL
jgi:hypothetical protein